MSEVCAPGAKGVHKNGCIPRLSLEKLVSVWNLQSPGDPIHIGRGMSNMRVWRELHRRLLNTCGGTGAGTELCWTEKLAPSLAKDHFRPQAPREWKKNRKAWLSNYDIQEVLEQYERGHKDFSFLGVFPIDFNQKGVFGKCLYDEMCRAIVPGMLEQKKRWVGAVFNLDRHDQPGSHWVSLMVCLDPKHPAYGANFYDSTGRKAPETVRTFMKGLQAQMPSKMPPLPLRETKVVHQYENTECGMFSVIFQVMFLEVPRLSVEEYEALPIRDRHANKMRATLFRI